MWKNGGPNFLDLISCDVCGAIGMEVLTHIFDSSSIFVADHLVICSMDAVILSNYYLLALFACLLSACAVLQTLVRVA